MTKFLNILKVSIKNINGNKLRTILTMLGLIIGIASVIILVGIGSGTSNQVTSQVQSLGADVLTLNITSSDTSLEYDNIDELKNIQDITAAAPYKTVSGTVTHGENSSGRANIIATTNEYMEVMNLTISSGRLLSTIDLDNNSKVCLLGSDIAETLFENDTVAGIGVMNVMLVSVTERTKEIGIRKALGAKRSDILIQFLIEALLLCIVGGIIGIGLGVGIGMLLNQMGYNFVPEIWIILIAFFSSVMIGLLFGIFPAYKASKLNPIDALHTE